MKPIIEMVGIIGIMILSNFKINAQVDVTNHNWVTNYYVGWSSAHSLDFKLGSTPTTYMSLLTSGDLEITNAGNGFWINGHPVLRFNGDVNNIFVGVGAGDNTTAGYNTFVGTNAGYTNTGGISNTFIGFAAGVWNTTISGVSGNYNTFTGYRSGEFNTIGGQNSFYGKRSGDNNTTGSWNCFFGSHCGYENDGGNYNAFFGKSE